MFEKVFVHCGYGQAGRATSDGDLPFVDDIGEPEVGVKPLGDWSEELSPEDSAWLSNMSDESIRALMDSTPTCGCDLNISIWSEGVEVGPANSWTSTPEFPHFGSGACCRSKYRIKSRQFRARMWLFAAISE